MLFPLLFLALVATTLPWGCCIPNIRVISQVYIDLWRRFCRFLAIKTMYERIYEACLPGDRKYRTVFVWTSLSFPFPLPMFLLFWNPCPRDGNAGKGFIRVYVYLYIISGRAVSRVGFMEHDRDLQRLSRPEASWIAESRGLCSARFRSSRSPLDSYAAIRTCSA